jgi:hypothetical protein
MTEQQKSEKQEVIICLVNERGFSEAKCLLHTVTTVNNTLEW